MKVAALDVTFFGLDVTFFWLRRNFFRNFFLCAHIPPGDASAWKRGASREAGASRGDMVHESDVMLCCTMEVCTYMFGCR